MTKTFEALEEAEKERERVESGIQPRKRPGALTETAVMVPSMMKTETIRALPERDLEDAMALLHQNISLHVQEGTGQVIQFVGTRKDEGTSVMVREYAKFSAFRLGKTVLLLDANRTEPCQLRFFNVEPSSGWEDCILKGTLITDTIHRIGEEHLFAGQLSTSPARSAQLSDMPKIGEFFERLRLQFDLVLIDSPVLTASPEALSMARKADGVVLVVDAEQTRKQATKRVRDRIVEHGGKVLGVILNKRKYPIPSFLYKFL